MVLSVVLISLLGNRLRNSTPIFAFASILMAISLYGSRKMKTLNQGTEIRLLLLRSYWVLDFFIMREVDIPSALKKAEAGDYTAKCLKCGYEAMDNYNWYT